MGNLSKNINGKLHVWQVRASPWDVYYEYVRVSFCINYLKLASNTSKPNSPLNSFIGVRFSEDIIIIF